MKTYIFEVRFKNGTSMRQKVMGDTREEAEQELRMRNDLAGWTYIGVEG